MAENKVRFLRGTAAEYASAVKDDDTFYYTTDDEKFYVGSKEITGGGITVDSELSDTSENPVQNKVVKQAIDNKANKSLYGDTTINVGRKANTTVGNYSTAEGYNTTASGYASHAEGSNAYISNGEIAFHDTRTVTISDDVTVEVDSSQSYGVNSHAEGSQTLAYEESSHAEGNQTTASGRYSHAEGNKTTASGGCSHAEGAETIASGGRCHAEGMWTIASGGANHAEGYGTTANGNNSCHAEGYQTTACGIATHVEGSSNNKATDLIPDLSWSSTTNDDIINAWNLQKFSLAHGRASHVEGHDNLTLGYASHAEGQDTVAIGDHSHTSGYYTKALHDDEAAYGKYNVSNENTLFSIGDGTADDARHNAFEITTTGGKLHDKDIATTDLIPTTLPANGGNADTLNGMSAEVIRSMSKNVESGTSVSSQLADGTYCGVWSDAPSGLTDTQGILIVSNYNTNGAPSPWSHRTFYSPHYNMIWHGFTANYNWYGWAEISTTPIKSEEFTASTDSWSHIQLFSTSENKKPLAVTFTNTPRTYSVFSHDGYCYLELYNNSMQTIPNTSVSFVLYYMEV